MKSDKRICIQCRGYATGECKEHSVYNVGTAFRPPKKSRVMAWKKLEQLYSGLPEGSTLYFSRHHSHFNDSTPKSVKENYEIERLKRRKLELQKIHSEKKFVTGTLKPI